MLKILYITVLWASGVPLLLGQAIKRAADPDHFRAG